MYTVAIVTSSDKGSKGEREDKSGAVIREIVEKSGFQVKRYVILPDEKELLKEEFIYLLSFSGSGKKKNSTQLSYHEGPLNSLTSILTFSSQEVNLTLISSFV